jgi:hypothetical protein
MEGAHRSKHTPTATRLAVVATFSAVARQHILEAIAEYDDRGRDAFLGVYGLQPSPRDSLIHDGKTYDSTAVLGVAHRYATGQLATSEELRDGKYAPAEILRKHGFDVTEPAGASAPRKGTASARSTASRPAATRPARRPAPEDRPVVICPTCFTQLPSTGQCDACA